MWLGVGFEVGLDGVEEGGLIVGGDVACAFDASGWP